MRESRFILTKPDAFGLVLLSLNQQLGKQCIVIVSFDYSAKNPTECNAEREELRNLDDCINFIMRLQHCCNLIATLKSAGHLFFLLYLKQPAADI